MFNSYLLGMDFAYVGTIHFGVKERYGPAYTRNVK